MNEQNGHTSKLLKVDDDTWGFITLVCEPLQQSEILHNKN